MKGRFILFSILLTSCNAFKDDFELKIAFPDVSGLTVSSIVTLNGLEVGRVKSIKLDKSYQAITTIFLTDNLPTDSQFTLFPNVFGQSEIRVTAGKSTSLFKTGQQVVGQIEKIKSSSEEGDNLIDNLFGIKKRDSLLLELRKLNRKVDSLMKR
jgi:ABC-type transporter Mla subunit MlaD